MGTCFHLPVCLGYFAGVIFLVHDLNFHRQPPPIQGPVAWHLSLTMSRDTHATQWPLLHHISRLHGARRALETRPGQQEGRE